MHKIFISYRREDSIETTGRIYDWLDTRLPPSSIFMDVDSIPPGTDFRVAIKDTITSSSVMLVIIGPRWLTVREPGGGPRIDNPNDWVRAEVELAIEHSIPIIPVLVQEATMPATDDLPASLTSLAYRNAVKVRPNPDFQNDMLRVMKGIESIDAEIVFSQQTRKAGEHEEKEPVKLEPELPPIPEGGTSEYGFYYTRVVSRQINEESKDQDHTVIKEFALSDSPTKKHEVGAAFSRTERYDWSPLRFGLAVRVDDTIIVEWHVELKYGRVGEEITTYGPDYDKSITLNGHTYRVKYKIEGTCTYKGGIMNKNYSWSYRVTEFEVSVDGYTLLDIDSLWD